MFAAASAIGLSVAACSGSAPSVEVTGDAGDATTDARVDQLAHSDFSQRNGEVAGGRAVLTPDRTLSPLPDYVAASPYISSGTDDVATDGTGRVVDSVAEWARDASVCVHIASDGLSGMGDCCSGTLISPRIVVTNAHCIRGNGGGNFATGLATHPVTFSPHDGSGTFPAGTPNSVTIPIVDCVPATGSNVPSCFDGLSDEWCNCVDIGCTAVNQDRDIAILVLAERVDHRLSGFGTTNFAAIPARVRLDDPSNDPAQWDLTGIFHVGYGPTSCGGCTLPALRQVVSQTISVGSLTTCGWSASIELWDMHGIPGDSGGGYISQRPVDGPMEIMGVHNGYIGSQDRGVRLTNSDIQTFLAGFIGSHASGYAGTNLTLPHGSVTMWTGADDRPPRPETRSGFADADTVDRDGDGLVDIHDNCPSIPNPEQRDGSIARPGTGHPTGIDVAGDGVADFADCLGMMI